MSFNKHPRNPAENPGFVLDQRGSLPSGWWQFPQASHVQRRMCSVADAPGECRWLGEGPGSDVEGTSAGA